MSEQSEKTVPDGIWEKAVALYRGTLVTEAERSQMERHFPQFLSKKIEGGEFLIGVADETQSEWFTPLYARPLEQAISALLPGGNLHVRFVVDKSAAKDIHKLVEAQKLKNMVKETSRPRQSSAFSSTVPLNESYTFESFVRGPSNSIAYATATAVAKKLGSTTYNPLFIYGGTGLGKTHLMQAIGNHVRSVDPSKSVCYITAEIFLNKYIEAVTNDSMRSFRDRYRNIDLLLIDDVQFIAGKRQFQEEFFNTFNALRDFDKQIVMTSDVSPKNLEGLEERLSSRFQQGVAIEIESPSYETRLAILTLKARLSHHIIKEEILQFIAENIRSHVRALEGALMLVVTFMDANPGLDITNDILSHLLRDLIDKEQELKRLSIDDIVKAVCTYYRVTEKEIRSSERPQPLATARQVAMFLARKLTGYSLQTIATNLDKKHCTVLYGTQTIQKRIDVEPELKHTLEEITAQLGRRPSELFE